MNAQLLRYGTRINGDHMRWCSICATQHPTERGKFVEHQTPAGKRCNNSGKSVKTTQAEAAG